MKPNSPKPLKLLHTNVPPLTLAKQYLYLEFLKIFHDVADFSFRRKLKLSLSRLDRRDGINAFWSLVSGIDEGLKGKWIFRLLTNPAYRWNLELRKIDDLTMTGFSPCAVDKVIERCHHRFDEFAEYYHAHPDFFKKYMSNLKPRPLRDRFPIFVYWDPRRKQLRLFDGMRRTSLAAINGRNSIKAYIGYPVRAGRPMVNPDKIQYLRLLFRAARTDSQTFKSFVRVGREIIRQSQNGARLFKSQIRPWSDEREKKLIKAILK